jgi:hypothetical protein
MKNEELNKLSIQELINLNAEILRIINSKRRELYGFKKENIKLKLLSYYENTNL